MPAYEFRLPSYPSTAFPSLTTAHAGMLARDRTLGGIRMFSGTDWVHEAGEVVNVKEFGAIGDGTSHPLSERYGSLTAAQVDYPHALALTDEIDWAAIQGALDSLTGGSFLGGEVLMPLGLYLITYQIQVPAQVSLLGTARGGCQIKAAPTFPVSTALVRLGKGTGIVFGCRIENLTVDCSDISGSIGVYSNEIQEESGVYRCEIQGFKSIGVDYDAPAAQCSIVDVECNCTAEATTIGIRLDANSGVIKLDRITVVGGAGTGADGILITGQGPVDINDVHIEAFADGIEFSTNSAGSASNILGAPDVTTLVRLNNSGGSVSLSSLVKNGGTNVLIDVFNATTLTDGSLTLYSVAPAVSVIRGAGGSARVLTLRNMSVAALGSTSAILDVGALNAADAGAALRLLNSGTGPHIRIQDDVELRRTAANELSLGDADNLAFGTTSGTKIGTSTSQKLAFWGQTPTTVSPAYTTAAISTGRVFPSTASISTDAGGAQFTSRADLEALVQVVAQMYEDLKGYGLLR